MEQIVYFADKAVGFASAPPAGEWHLLHSSAAGDISRAKILKILETHNKLAVIAPDPARMYDAFAWWFTPVEAAGGIVVNERGEWLMIHRNDRWDLPKGHIESGESPELCAVREVAEETGVCGAEIVRPLCRTLHAYYFPKNDRWELKRTHWFELRVGSCESLTPQREEGIVCVAWCRPEQVDEHLREAFPTIRCVARAMKSE